MSTTAAPVVSFLVHTGENAHHLKECVESIRFQSFMDLEVLLLDTWHNPEATELAQAYTRADERVRHLILPSSNGLADSLNHGIRQSCGDLIWIMQPKDRLASAQALQDCVTQFILSPRLGMAFCRVQHMDEISTPYECYVPPKNNSEMPYHQTLYPGRIFFKEIIKGNFIPESAAIARKICFERAGDVEPDLEESCLWQHWMRFCMDWDVHFDPMPKVLSRRPRHAPDELPFKSDHELEDELQCYMRLEHYLKSHDYPAAFRHQAQFARLQFMRRKGLKLSLPERLIRAYRKLTAASIRLHPLED